MNIKNIYAIHKLHDSERARFYKDNSQIHWSESSKKWICTNKDLAELILKDRDFRVVTSAPKKIMEMLNIDLKEIIKLSSYLPMLNEGEEHGILRKRFAIQIAKKTPEILNDFENHFYPQLDFLTRSSSSFDICKDLLYPQIHSSLSLMADLENLKLPNISILSSIFDETTSIKRRQELNASIKKIIDILRIKFSEDECYFKVAMLTAGNDSLLSTITSSILSTLLRHEDKFLNAMPWQLKFSSTGVPVIERICAQDTKKYGVSIRTGDRVRIYIEAASFKESETSSYSQLFFAAGPHICPGMSIGNHLWEKTSEAFLKINKKIKVIKIIRRETDNVFNTYESIKIDVLN